MKPLRRAIAFAVPLLAVALCAAQPATPVLVELFTSEGCSDCPPADRLLQRLDAASPVPGVDVIVLSEHVTYWNYLGWSDPFSLPAADARQRRYGDLFHLNSVYTPQAVVDGSAHMVGSDERGLLQAIAAARPKAALSIENPRWINGQAHFALRASLAPSVQVFVALAADATRSEVARGENAGRTLHHVAVLRVLRQLGSGALNGHEIVLPGDALTRGPEASGPLRLIAFAVDPASGRVLAAAQVRLPR